MMYVPMVITMAARKEVKLSRSLRGGNVFSHDLWWINVCLGVDHLISGGGATIFPPDTIFFLMKF